MYDYLLDTDQQTYYSRNWISSMMLWSGINRRLPVLLNGDRLDDLLAKYVILNFSIYNFSNGDIGWFNSYLSGEQKLIPFTFWSSNVQKNKHISISLINSKTIFSNLLRFDLFPECKHPIELNINTLKFCMGYQIEEQLFANIFRSNFLEISFFWEYLFSDKNWILLYKNIRVLSGICLIKLSEFLSS